MSHRESTLTPWIASYTDSFSAAGASTLTLTGFGLSLSTDVDLGSLGSETGRTYTATDGDGNGNLVISLTVAALPESPATVQVAVSNGGIVAQQSPLSVLHGFNPSALCTGDKDYWWNPDSITGLSDGDRISSFTDSAQGYTLTQGTTNARLEYKSSYAFTASKSAAALISKTSRSFPENVIPLNLTDGSLDLTFAFVVKLTSVADSNWLVNIPIGNNDNRRFSVALRTKDVSLRAGGTWFGYDDNNNDIFSDNQIVAAILTGENGSATFQAIPGTSPTLTTSYTPKTAPTAVSAMMRGQGHKEVAFGETLLLSRAITSAEITQLQSYWSDKYGS